MYGKKLINNFLKRVIFKKKYFKTLNKKQKIQNLNLAFKNNFFEKNKNLITYIINISFSPTNTLLHLTNSLGVLKFVCSAGKLFYTGKNKKTRFLIIKSMIHVLLLKFKTLKNKPIILHLKNVSFTKFWIIKKFKIIFFLKAIKIYNSYPYNGCRKKKIRRKKFKKITIKKKWLSGFKAADCKSVEIYFIAGSNPVFFIFFFYKI